jgi:cephalosporin hydroxylase
MMFMEEALDRPLSKVLPVMQQRIMEHTTYHGIPTLKNPLDFWVYQEILWETRPEVIIEIGNLYGGSALALAHACDAIGKGKIIGVDSDHSKVSSEVRMHPRITLVTGDACEMLPSVKRALDGEQQVMIIEDSLHTYEHTLSVLEGYAELVGAGQYFIVEDGICHHGLEVGPQPGPYEAIETFISRNKTFIVDRTREAFGITWNPKGYLKKIAQ